MQEPKKMDVAECLVSIADSLEKSVHILERIEEKITPANAQKKTKE